MKKCNTCHEFKCESKYYKDRSKKYGLRNSCKSCEKIKEKEYYLKNKKSHSERSKKYYEDNKEKTLLLAREYRKENIFKVKEREKRYRQKNKDKIAKRKMDYKKLRYRIDPLFRLSETLRARTRLAFINGGYTKKTKTFEMFGCSFEYLTHHIERQFKKGMNWDNYGEWHIDHIIPISIAKTEDELIKLNHYTNIQPLWASENQHKSNKCPILWAQENGDLL